MADLTVELVELRHAQYCRERDNKYNPYSSMMNYLTNIESQLEL